ncbi:unnamed protein product [marine sediment metagenome]|uniref:Uncharacterized protein n=1 Tax=marine sediment metagenome TaxID=412755 RepID=X0S829_9ZZZZ
MVSILQRPGDDFSYAAMKQYAAYANTFTHASGTLAIDSTTTQIKTAGGQVATMNGQILKAVIAASTGLNLATEHREQAKAAWADGSSYSLGSIAWNDGIRYRCITAHTAEDDITATTTVNEPGHSDNWAAYWEKAPHAAVYAGNASSGAGGELTSKWERWYMVTAESDGSLGMWEAGDEVLGTAVLKVPQFDPKMYVVCGFIHIDNQLSSTFTIGSGSLSSTTETYINQIGPVWPHPDNFAASWEQ